ncbi:sigma-54-dependent Fis family transcriptional regulator [uncultured Dysosmobacter sp.]|uniref:sigma-54 interaction domain-containing protein n=1 Tax=uncultured Dysosmobacter sp. TaxID=2591384 RepID=UPI002635313E|nr:sigma 54-interacting transcriptional regulator [uncultured Dysosmobacter sp.]
MEFPFDLVTFKNLIDHAYDGIGIWNKEGKLIYINNACYRRYGVSPEEMIGKNTEYFTTGEKPFWDVSTSPRAFQEKKPVLQKYRSLSGLDVTMITVPVLDNQGEVEYVIQTSRDDDRHLFEYISPMVQDAALGEHEETAENRCRIVYKSAQFQELMKEASEIANTDVPCLILGETGTGKNMLAEHIHRISDRRKKPFIYVNVASLNPNLIESQLFGYCKGAFSGAQKSGSQGLFKAADGGVIFLDEIGEMPLELQSKILHVVQTGEFIPVGGVKAERVDVRILSATNCSLHDMVKSGRFRQDLYHRLSVVELYIPPLRSRPDDLALLITFFLNQFNKKYGKLCTLAKETRDILLRYSYNGNVRELSNIMERCVLMTKDSEIKPIALPKNVFSIAAQQQVHQDYTVTQGSLEKTMQEFERQLVCKAYRENPSSRRLAAALQISQTKASRLIRKYVLEEKSSLPEE